MSDSKPISCRLGFHRTWIDTNGSVSVFRCNCGWTNDSAQLAQLEAMRERHSRG